MSLKFENVINIGVFVTLWGSAAIFTKWGLHYGSVIAFLFFRFLIATVVILIYCVKNKLPYYPNQTSWKYIVFTGLFLIAGYTLFYFLSLDYGISPGLLATILALQPILSFFITEKSFSKLKLIGLVLSFIGIICLVYNSIFVNKLSLWATICALLCLGSITLGAILQKNIKDKPWQVLPLQYAVALVIFAVIIPFQTFNFDVSWNFWLPVFWLGIIVSVLAQLIFYKLLQSGNLVNVTSLFYLVPLVTLILDFIIFRVELGSLDLLGISAILLGVYLVYKKPLNKIDKSVSDLS
ncbi:EamA family transporter [Acinetobacter sp. ANC 4558]|uniref:DMT family transporter n=1 Tax=Acinetobacter sp. ANC 4558 TaxID=1977876 RepID=UPI000A34C719|nr:DMT family transporter [Acinetobacter sp. ANC 4558]OTG85914.1 EamA family transporter [Acinetobacter sp. ANC 4558]